MQIYIPSNSPHLKRMYNIALLLILTTFMVNGYFGPEDTVFVTPTLERMTNASSHLINTIVQNIKLKRKQFEKTRIQIKSPLRAKNCQKDRIPVVYLRERSAYTKGNTIKICWFICEICV